MDAAWAMAAMLWPIKFLGGFVPVLIPSAIQMIAPNNMRAQLSAAEAEVARLGAALDACRAHGEKAADLASRLEVKQHQAQLQW